MPLEHHGLVKEFPQMREVIQQMKATDAHFSKLFNEYDALDHEIFNAESGALTYSDEHIEALKKQRVTLKDELFAMLKGAQAA